MANPAPRPAASQFSFCASGVESSPGGPVALRKSVRRATKVGVSLLNNPPPHRHQISNTSSRAPPAGGGRSQVTRGPPMRSLSKAFINSHLPLSISVTSSVNRLMLTRGRVHMPRPGTQKPHHLGYCSRSCSPMCDSRPQLGSMRTGPMVGDSAGSRPGTVDLNTDELNNLR